MTNARKYAWRAVEAIRQRYVLEHEALGMIVDVLEPLFARALLEVSEEQAEANVEAILAAAHGRMA